MPVFFNTGTSSTGGSFIITNGWGSYSPPPPPPYTGTYLPAVIHVFDHELDLADRKVDELASIATQLETEFVALNRAATQSCSSLEPEYPEDIQAVRNLEIKVRALANKINRLRNGNALPSAEDSTDGVPEDSTDPDTDQDIEKLAKSTRPEDREAYTAAVNRILKNLRAADSQRNAAQKRVKNGPAKVKAVFRQIMMLIHPDRHKANKYTKELYALAERARQQEDLGSLNGILAAAKQYRSSQSKLALRNFLNQKAVALRNHVAETQKAVRNIQNDPAYQVHKFLEAGKRDDAKDLFLAILQNMQAALRQQMNSLEFEHSALTGTFSDGSTSQTFSP